MNPTAAAESIKRTGDEVNLVDGIIQTDSDGKPPAKRSRTSAGSPPAASTLQNLLSLAAMHANRTDFTVDEYTRKLLQDFCAQRHPMAEKLESLMEFPRTVKGTFELDHRLTFQLQALQSSERQDVHVDDLEDYCQPMSCYNVPTSKKHFMRLALKSSNLYVRSGYRRLYDEICKQWLKDEYHVCLIGNAGTGKSLFQLYVLKQLLSEREDSKYDFVIRQVNSKFYLIDLSDASVYEWDTEDDHIESCSIDLLRTLYFFEPMNNKERSPLYLEIPSLSTLSPYARRISEYVKTNFTALYFWPWSRSETWAFMSNENDAADYDEFTERYYKFGGILRHVLGQKTTVEEDLITPLKEAKLEVLSSISLDIDRENSSGETVSGLLVCYDNRGTT